MTVVVALLIAAADPAAAYRDLDRSKPAGDEARTRHRDNRAIGVEEGLEGDDLVTRFAQREDRRRDALGRAGSDEDLAVGIERQIVKLQAHP